MGIDEVPVGIIGPGAIGDVHARVLARAGARIVAVAGANSAETAEFAEQHAIPRAFAHHVELLESGEVDAVVVATPSALHAPITLDAIKAGKHVLTEVPLALSAADAEEVVTAAGNSEYTVAVGHTLRHWAPHRRLAEVLAEAKTPPTQVHVRSLMLRQDNVGWTGKVRDWTDNVLWHHGSHAFDAALWFLGEDAPTLLGSCGPTWPASGNPMDVAAVLVGSDGRLANVNLSYHSRKSASDFLVILEDETYEISDGQLHSSKGILYDSAGTAAVQEEAVEAQDRDFLESVLEGRPPRFGAEQALPTIRLLQALEDTRKGASHLA